MMERRSFMAGAALSPATMGTAAAAATARASGKFKLRYAPRINAFPAHVGNDPIENVKIVNDLYHQQICEGNLIPNIDRA